MAVSSSSSYLDAESGAMEHIALENLLIGAAKEELKERNK